MPNLIAYGALLFWPLVTLFLFLAMPTRRAVIWSLLAGYLLLPVSTAFELQGVPDMDKTTIPNVATFLFAAVLARRGEFRWPRSTLVNLMILVVVLGPFATGLANQDPQQAGDYIRPAMTMYDSLSMAGYKLIDVLPFIVGAGFLRDEKSHRELLMALVIAALLYSLLILEEIRMAPLLASKLYSISNTAFFIQNMRSGGFRAMVFLGHGLLVSAFLTLAIMAAGGLWRERRAVWGVPASLVVFYLLAVLFLNKSAGSVVLTALLLPALILLPVRRFLTVAAVIGGLIFTYPLFRSADLVPTDSIEWAANKYSAARAESFAFRVRNEDLLLQRAMERPVLGWGAWGRHRVLAQAWDGNFRDASVTDGTWIITIGIVGWVGYLSLFGLLTYPVWRAFRLRNRGFPIASTALVGVLILNLIDLIPNSSLGPLTWLAAGALTGLVVAPEWRKAGKPARVAPSFNRMTPATT